METEEASAKSQQNKIAFMETSAKDNDNVSKAFMTLFEEILKVYKAKNSDVINNIEERKRKVEEDMENPKVVLSQECLEDTLFKLMLLKII